MEIDLIDFILRRTVQDFHGSATARADYMSGCADFGPPSSRSQAQLFGHAHTTSL